jgi:PncC family amidohydrolase
MSLTVTKPAASIAQVTQELQDQLVRMESTVATAESLTGGQLAARLTALPGSSASFVGGVVSYATEVKVDVLGVPAEVIDKHGVVSGECAVAMAEGVRDLLGTTYGVSTTGVAGPERQEGKEPGTVWIAVAGPAGAAPSRLQLEGGREDVQRAACEAALAALTDVLRREEPALG